MSSLGTTLVRNLRDQIAERLRDEILSGRLTEGEPLREVDLAKRFGVSRSPIRDALLQLTCEGVVVNKSRRGMRVAASPPDLIQEVLVPLRRSVETFALSRFFHEINDDDSRLWQRILHDMKFACEHADYFAIAEQDIAFHRSILVRADQPELMAVWLTLANRMRRHFQETQKNYANPLSIYIEHAALVTTFRSGDLAAAIGALERNIA